MRRRKCSLLRSPGRTKVPPAGMLRLNCAFSASRSVSADGIRIQKCTFCQTIIMEGGPKASPADMFRPNYAFSAIRWVSEVVSCSKSGHSAEPWRGYRIFANGTMLRPKCAFFAPRHCMPRHCMSAGLVCTELVRRDWSED